MERITTTKIVGATLDYRLDWSAYLGADMISSVAWTVSGATAGAASNTTTTATQRISGGSAGTTATARCAITTAAGVVDARTINIDIVASLVAREVLKSPAATIPIPAPTWTDLGSDPISTYAWSAASGLTIASGGSSATVVVSGGTAGQDYDLTCTVTTSAGQVDARVIRVQVRAL